MPDRRFAGVWVCVQKLARQITMQLRLTLPCPHATIEIRRPHLFSGKMDIRRSKLQRMARGAGAVQYIYMHGGDALNLWVAPLMIARSSLGRGGIPADRLESWPVDRPDRISAAGADNAAGTTTSNASPVSSAKSQKRISVLSAGERKGGLRGLWGRPTKPPSP